MRRNEYTHRRRHISNRHLSDKYYYAGEHETATGIRLTQYNERSLHTKEVRITDTSFRDGQQSMAPYTVEQIVDLYKLIGSRLAD